jgi:hypothetical protein
MSWRASSRSLHPLRACASAKIRGQLDGTGQPGPDFVQTDESARPSRLGGSISAGLDEASGGHAMLPTVFLVKLSERLEPTCAVYVASDRVARFDCRAGDRF